MVRWAAIAALGAAFLAMPVLAQRHGGGSGGRSGFGGGGAAVSRGGGFAGGGARFGGGFGGVRGPGFGGSGFGGPGFRGPGFRGPGYYRGGFYGSRFYLGYPWYYGYPGIYYGYPGYYADDYAPPYGSYPSYNAPADYTDPSAQIQQDEIDRLENEVDRLREQRAPRDEARLTVPRPPTTRAQTDQQPATVLVFRDKHTQEVRNYAVVGRTLWVFNEERATKIPLAEIDVAATRNANDDRGVDFQVPADR